jgi:hypothetical protein
MLAAAPPPLRSTALNGIDRAHGAMSLAERLAVLEQAVSSLGSACVASVQPPSYCSGVSCGHHWRRASMIRAEPSALRRTRAG